MKKSKLMFVPLACLLAMPVSAAANSYIGVGGNRASIDDSDFDDDDTTYNAALGLMFNDFVGIEIGYYDLGRYESGAGELENEAWTGALLLSAPFGNSSNIYGKFGAARLDSTGTLFGVPFDSDETENFYGAGINFGVGPVALYVEWTQFDSERDVDVIGAGVRLLF